MDVSPLSDKELRFLRGLIERDVHFMVVDLSAAALQGAPVVTQDVDLWFEDLSDPRIREAARHVGAAYVPQFNLNPPMFAGAGTELFDIVLTLQGLGSFEEEVRGCIEVHLENHRLKVLPLARILVSKRAANRQKDRLVIPVLEDTLAAARSREKSTQYPPSSKES